jgi:hypothetical protein
MVPNEDVTGPAAGSGTAAAGNGGGIRVASSAGPASPAGEDSSPLAAGLASTG